MLRSEKPAYIAAVKEAVSHASIVIVVKKTDYTVANSLGLRRAVRDAGGSLQVSKNTLCRLAVQGTVCEVLTPAFVGRTAVVTGHDPVGLCKVLVDEEKKFPDHLQVLSAVMDGRLLSAEDVRTLSKLPSMDVLRGMLIGLIQAPATKIAGVVQAPAAQLARLLSAYSKK
ncbi:MAG: 50S ribosomal protein L10 [Alphaproteobacteria bacterium]